ncbi:hypothetical protein J6590_071253, partial [Homalodisca vitripennis]
MLRKSDDRFALRPMPQFYLHPSLVRGCHVCALGSCGVTSLWFILSTLEEEGRLQPRNL